MINPSKGTGFDSYPCVPNNEINGIKEGDAKNCVNTPSDIVPDIPANSEEELVEIDVDDNSDDEQPAITDVKDDTDDTASESADKNSNDTGIAKIFSDIANKAKRLIENIKHPKLAKEAKETALKLNNVMCSEKNDGSKHNEIMELIYSEIDAVNFDLVAGEYKDLTGKDLNKSLETLYKQFPDKKDYIDGLLTSVQSYKNSDSQIENEYYKGDKHSVTREGSIVTITNEKTQKTRQIDLKVLLENYTNPKERRFLTETLEKLPAEVLMDIAAEQTSFVNYTGEAIGGRRGLSGYNIKTDELYLNSNNTMTAITHEVGHSVDYKKIRGKNTSSVKNDEEFMKVFNSEMENYLAAGKKKYQADVGTSSSKETYATMNETEMFAECYTLLMLGACASDKVITECFPKTFEYTKTLLEKNRGLKDGVRH